MVISWIRFLNCDDARLGNPARLKRSCTGGISHFLRNATGEFYSSGGEEELMVRKATVRSDIA
jgi:hypothetical protein